MNEFIEEITTCPCQSGLCYQDCCEGFHRFKKKPINAEQLMRSRYCAYVLKNIDYIQQTTVPSQQSLLDMDALLNWAESTEWQGLTILQHKALSPIHSAVEFEAHYQSAQGQQIHHEYSVFVNINQRWYFIDPTVARPTMKQPCICGTNKKFKHCCGAFL